MSLVLCSLVAWTVGQPVQDAPPLGSVERTVAARAHRYFPVLIAEGDGVLSAAVRGGAPHLGIGGRLDLIRSTDGGVTWSEPVTMVDSEWDDRNPAYGVMPDGSLVLGYGECRCYNDAGEWDPSAGPFVLFYIRSEDGGLTWSGKAPLEHPYGPGCSPYGRILVLPSGAALMSVYGSPTEESAPLFTVGDPEGADACGFVVSRDNGTTWGEYTPIARGYNETALVAMPDGELLAFARSSGDQHLALLRSTDGGATWSDPERLTLGAQHPGDAAVLPSGEVLVVYGSRLAPYGVQAMVGTPDELARAPRVALANDSLRTDQGYPSVVVGEDGVATVVYYAVGTEEIPDDAMILSLRFDPDDMPRTEAAP